MTVTIDGTDLVDQPLILTWGIRPIGITGGGKVTMPSRTSVNLSFRQVPLVSGSISQMMDAWDNKPHTFMMPHYITRVDTLYSGVYVKSVDVTIDHMSGNTLAQSCTVTLTNVRFND